MFQSTHPLGVRLSSICYASGYTKVSIHAPTRGATESELILNGGEMFQSTHPLGVRLKRCRQLTPFCLFQSTHPLGVRRRVEFSMNSEGRFNPRTHSGCDLSALPAFSGPQTFQSTHPLGVRHADEVDKNGKVVFQSTHPLGVRQYTSCRAYKADMFQSTHPLGVRLYDEGRE